jgi:hypothetical protein
MPTGQRPEVSMRPVLLAVLVVVAAGGCGEDELEKLQAETVRVGDGLVGQIELDTDVSTDADCFKGDKDYGCHVHRSRDQQDGPATLLNYTVTWQPNSEGDKEWRAEARQSLAGLPRVVEFDAVPDFAPSFP